MEPIPRPAAQADTPAKAGGPQAAPTPAAEPAPDPAKVTLRWKVAENAPDAFRLDTEGTLTLPPPPAPPPKRGKKAPPPPEPVVKEIKGTSTYVLQKAESGDYTFRIVPKEKGGVATQGTMSERGFVLGGLEGPQRNVAALVLELPRDPVAVGDTWSLGTDLVDMSAFGPNFLEEKSDRANTVKLSALTPAGDGEQVATLEYDLYEKLSGQARNTKPPTPVSTEVRVKGKGEFLVKAGRWRSWKGTFTTHNEGSLPPVTKDKKGPKFTAEDSERTLRLTPLETVPPELLVATETK
jgi:hypothetical protein